MLDSMLNGALIGGGTALVLLLGYTFIRKPVTCESCGAEQPKFRKPADFNQAMFGGYVCGGCGKRLDAKGRVKAG